VLECGGDDARAAAALVAHVLGAFQVGHIADECVESGRLGQLPSSFNYTADYVTVINFNELLCTDLMFLV
jgi:hypothetical protein